MHWNLTNKMATASGMMPPYLKWTKSASMEYSRTIRKTTLDPKTRKVTNAPSGYQKIRVHLVFAVKHDGRHNARLVASGHLTPDPVELWHCIDQIIQISHLLSQNEQYEGMGSWHR